VDVLALLELVLEHEVPDLVCDREPLPLRGFPDRVHANQCSIDTGYQKSRCVT
jgi:hypothetical protein